MKKLQETTEIKPLSRNEITKLKTNFQLLVMGLVFVLLPLLACILYACFVDLTIKGSIGIFICLLLLNPLFKRMLEYYQDLTFKNKIVFAKVVKTKRRNNEQDQKNSCFLCFENDFLIKECAVPFRVFQKIREGDKLTIERTQYTKKILLIDWEGGQHKVY